MSVLVFGEFSSETAEFAGVLWDVWEGLPGFSGEAVAEAYPGRSVVAEGDDVDVWGSGDLDDFSGHVLSFDISIYVAYAAYAAISL